MDVAAAAWLSTDGSLPLGSLFVLGVPHASLGVVVVEEVAQAQPLDLQAVLQDPAGGTNTRSNGLKMCLHRENKTVLVHSTII